MSLHNLKDGQVSHTVHFNHDVMLPSAAAYLMHKIPDLTPVADTHIVDRHLQDCKFVKEL